MKKWALRFFLYLSNTRCFLQFLHSGVTPHHGGKPRKKTRTPPVFFNKPLRLEESIVTTQLHLPQSGAHHSSRLNYTHYRQPEDIINNSVWGRKTEKHMTGRRTTEGDTRTTYRYVQHRRFPLANGWVSTDLSVATRVKHPARYQSRQETITSSDIELPEGWTQVSRTRSQSCEPPT